MRNIDKRNPTLNAAAIEATPARWIAADALRELNSGVVQVRIKQRIRRGLLILVSLTAVMESPMFG